jgi:hydroxymethylpyrimidine pyrophosphatase-like HAD family hydrolase
MPAPGRYHGLRPSSSTCALGYHGLDDPLHRSLRKEKTRLRFLAIATDYDATVATEGDADPPGLVALRLAQATGRKLILITGRELESLRDVFPEWSLFDLVVAENGALLYHPATNRERLLCEVAPESLVAALRRRGVRPLSVGRSIIATVIPQETVVLETIHDLRLNWHVILNRESVMILPKGVNKGTGFAAALAELGLAGENVMGIGDAENDDAFLRLCGLSVAVANAIPSLKKLTNLVTKGERGAGVAEAVQHLLSIDGAE